MSKEDLRQKSPIFSIDEAKTIAKENYNLIDFVETLPSERDQNFLFQKDSSKYILKISNIDEDQSILEMQIAVIDHLQHRAKVVPNNDGKPLFKYKNHFVRLVTYLPGIPLAKYSSPNRQLYFNLGKLLGEMDRSLQTFDHPAARRDFYWDIKNAPMIINQYKNSIKDEQYRQIVEEVLQYWMTVVLPHQSSLRMSIIHNDANDYNILVIDGNHLSLIDFGDMCYTYLVSEVAIACAYAMLDKTDLVDTAKQIIQGYHDVFPLTEIELKLSIYFILMRLALSVTISAYERSLQPENEYLFVSEKSAWNLLQQLTNFDQQSLEQQFSSVS